MSGNLIGECFSSQLSSNGMSINPDVGGVAVGVANIAINILLPILLMWSAGKVEIHTSVAILFSQILPISIAAVASIGSGNLSLFDAHFVVVLTASPISIYVVYSAAREVVGIPNTLFKRLGDAKVTKYIICCLSFILLVLWIVLVIVTSFSSTAFRGSHLCKGMTFSLWIQNWIASFFFGTLSVMDNYDMWQDLEQRGGLGAVAVILLWFWSIYIVAHFKAICEMFRERKQQQGGWLRYLFIAGQFPLALWEVVTRAHPWMAFAVVICLHWSWVLGIARGMLWQKAMLSYGQILSLFSILPPLLATYELWHANRTEFARFLRQLPADFCDNVLFILTGSPDPSCSPGLPLSRPESSPYEKEPISFPEPTLRPSFDGSVASCTCELPSSK